jgi:aldehyde dehydrogenase (NAD+)
MVKIDKKGLFPELIPNWINGEEKSCISGDTIPKLSPHSGKQISNLSRSKSEDIDLCISSLSNNKAKWSSIPPVERGFILHKVCNLLEDKQEIMAEIVHLETGKSFNDALGETKGAISLGRFFAGEGQRLYGRTTTSGQRDKYSMTVRQPCGVAGLIIAANTPIANVAWKVFPALVCGNSCILKAPEDTPAVAWFFC